MPVTPLRPAPSRPFDTLCFWILDLGSFAAKFLAPHARTYGRGKRRFDIHPFVKSHVPPEKISTPIHYINK